MNPKHERLVRLAIALGYAPDAVFERAWDLVFGIQSEWQRLTAGSRFVEIVGPIETHLPIEQAPTAVGVSEVPCPDGKIGRAAYEQVLKCHKPVGPGSALLYIAAHQKHTGKLVITDRAWQCADDGHEYVAICDCASGSIYPELVDDLDASHTFLVR